ncbi:hypothetical protein [Streptomyces sp. NPDC094032]|uniref:hypothetical protein n=1 Tax=Streptomyces sp. NPDC094032 TaxID=3155308 RepID=UPI00333170B6
MSRRVRATVAMVTAVTAMSLVWGGASAAQATESATSGPGWYRVNATDGVFTRYQPSYGAAVVGSANYGSYVYVVCQEAHGGWDNVHMQYGRPFTTWDRLSDGTYVYDWWMDTPIVAEDGHSPGIPACVYAP